MMDKLDTMWIADALQDIEMGCIKHGLVDVAETVRQAVLEYSAAMEVEVQSSVPPATPHLTLVTG